MVTNETSQNEIEFTANHQQASGQSIFWALAAIVLNTMLQPSFSGYLLSRDAFRSSLWPHRSSPTICILDAVAEIWIFIEKYYKTGPGHDETTAAKPTDVAMRLTIFVLAVLPQAIKLFSMRGIPVTQALAAMFLVSSLVSMMRAMCVDAPHKDVSNLVDRLKTCNNVSKAKSVVGLFGWKLHGITLFYMWYQIAGEAKITTTENITNAMQWVSVLVSTTWMAYVLVHTTFTIMGVKPPIRCYPILMILDYTDTFGIPSLMLAPKARSARGRRRVRFAAALLLNVALCSYGIAYVLELSAKIILKWSRRTPFSIDSRHELPVTTLNVYDRPESILSTANEAQHTSDIASPDRSTTNRDLSATYNQADLVTTAAISLLPQALDNQETASETNVAGTEQSTSESVPTPALNEVNSLSTIEATPMQHTISNLEALSGESRNGETAAMSSANGTDNASLNETSTTEHAPAPEGDLPFLLNLRVHIIVYLVIALLWCSYIIEPITDEDRETTRQSAAEQGTGGQRTEESGHPDSSQSLPRWIKILINKAFWFIIKWTLTLIWRFMSSLFSIVDCSVVWIKRKVNGHSKDTLLVAFGIANFMTAMVYYLTLFDGKGTFTPQWTSVLG